MSAPSPGADALARLVAPVRGRLLAARALQVLASVATVAPYVAVAELARGMLAGAGGRADAGTWVLVAVVGLLVRAVAGQVAYGVAHVADLHLQAGLRRDLTARLATLPLGWFGRRASGVVRSHLQDDVGALHSQVAHGAVEQTAAVATPLAALAYVAVLDWRLALVAAFVVPVHLAVQAAAMRGLGDDLAAMGQGMLRLSAAVVELVGGIAVVKMYGRAGVAHERYRRAATDFGDGYASWVGPMTRRSALVSVVLSAPTVLLVMLAAGSWAVSAGWTGPVEAVTAALVAATVPPAFVAVSAAAQSRREAEAASLALVALLDEPALGEPDHPLDPDGTDLRLEGVSFGYEPDRPVLEAIDLELPAGTLTALVGPSGAGKSTLAGLVARFHDPDAGRVLLGGVDLREIGSAGVARTVGLVLQDPQLVAVSIADNIRLPRPGASDAEVRAAAVAARVADEIDALPRGFDSVIGTDAQLSGGQEQRVAIARALLGDPGVVLLDEATAYADPTAEADIQRALGELLRGRTVVVIAHRLETVVAADQIVVLDGGRVVERGTHPELLAADGTYARMWAAGPARHSARGAGTAGAAGTESGAGTEGGSGTARGPASAQGHASPQVAGTAPEGAR